MPKLINLMILVSNAGIAVANWMIYSESGNPLCLAVAVVCTAITGWYAAK